MRIIFIGSGAFAIPTLRWLSTSSHEVPLVVTQPARPSGRGRRTTPTPVRALSDELALEAVEVEDVNAAGVLDRLASLDARLGLVVAFGQKLGPALLDSMPGGCVNLHASLLPKYRGAAPINWAIVCGEQRTGCTVFRVVHRMDAGPILSTCETPVSPGETAGELHDRLAEFGVQAVQGALGMCENGALPEGTTQNEDEATQAPKLKKSDGFVRFDRSAADVANHIRGMTPWPGAAARFEAADGRWEKVNINRVQPVVGPETPRVQPGVLDERLFAAVRDGFVEILELQPSSGRVMAWADYVNGRHVKPGDSFGTL